MRKGFWVLDYCGAMPHLTYFLFYFAEVEVRNRLVVIEGRGVVFLSLVYRRFNENTLLRLCLDSLWIFGIAAGVCLQPNAFVSRYAPDRAYRVCITAPSRK